MDKAEKRSFDQMEQSSVDAYVYSANDLESLKHWAAKRPAFSTKPENQDSDINTKMAALKASYSVVSLVSFSGELIVSQCSGTIIEAEENNNTVMTSLNLIRRPTEANTVENSIAENLKIIVRSSDKNPYIGEVYAYDLHYNILMIKFKSKSPLQSAQIGLIDDDIGLVRSFQLQPHRLKVKPGDCVIVAGRHFYRPVDFMCASGCFSMDRREPEYDCRELLSANCYITTCGDGGPLINLSGEVIGIAFYELGPTTPFLPINIAYKWWNHYKRYKEKRHPSYGFEASNLYLATVPTIERVVTSFPKTVSNGVLVEKVVPGSYAESAGLREDDVIIKCDGKIVESFLELWNLLWPKVGDVVVLEVARCDICAIMSISMVVGEAVPNELNNWPRHDYC